jgi:hypothetical protein
MESLALYGRWWQLENWLRLLAYTTLRAAYGKGWEGELEKRAVSRALKDLLHAHIMSPDQANTLAYLDVTDLFELIDSNWTLFEPFLLPQSIWQGRIIELNSIRRSIAHCRRPHRDDRSRVEQTLRDLEPGFWSALEGQAAGPVDPTLSDPVVDDWNKGQLQYLRNSVARRYRYIDVELGLARQPWANYDGNRPATGTPGLLWALDISGSGERWIEPTAYWTQLNPKTQNTLVHVFMSTSFGVRVTFAAVDSANLVIDAMIDCIEAFMQASWHVSRMSTARAESWPGDIHARHPRILVEELFAVSDGTRDGSVFVAG